MVSRLVYTHFPLYSWGTFSKNCVIKGLETFNTSKVSFRTLIRQAKCMHEMSTWEFVTTFLVFNII
ncbi:ORF904 [White spot syndrome virus]|uniref:Wsv404 n=3 Tax=White spot syndrome virus TaxID=342409 RepID=Q8VAK1_WSSVS|nr:wsv404 [Shrimp white spot syndrome virus]AFX59781.1 wsv404 [White spot syndrome virus]AAL33406.1 wsv404 [Shrimp white spot syndrome virus]AAL89331.1 WSSV463 [Shrimp white spot syndrome virus]ATU84094.1 ORF904 [White spot syndrome virus]AWQ60528.1 wsv404 [Shrimp white spot syndrome virus]